MATSSHTRHRDPTLWGTKGLFQIIGEAQALVYAEGGAEVRPHIVDVRSRQLFEEGHQSGEFHLRTYHTTETSNEKSRRCGIRIDANMDSDGTVKRSESSSTRVSHSQIHSQKHSL